MAFFLCLWLVASLCIAYVVALIEQATTSFNNTAGALLIAHDNGVSPIIYVDNAEWPGVIRAANDLALDFGRVTGMNATVVIANTDNITATTAPAIIVGTIGRSSLVDSLSQSTINVSQTQGQWEAFQSQLVSNPMTGISQALVIAGADKRGSIYGIYDISQQIGVSPWYWWADVTVMAQNQIYALNITKTQPSPTVKYRGLFINDEQPALNNWVQENYEANYYGPGFNHLMYSTMFELLLRLRANYLWPASWNSMFNVDDLENQPLADMYGIVMGTSHTEPMMRATKEQSLFLNGTWSWSTNEQNVLDFMQYGAERARPYESLYSMGMRGLGDVASPTLNASSLQDIVQHQQQILSQVYNISNVSVIPQMWCLYKEVGGYFAAGLQVPDDITLMWADDNWSNMQRLPLINETSRSGGAGIYYHFDYVGDPRDYKWINTISLQKNWEQLQQAYQRQARQIWLVNVGDLKPLELPISQFFDMAYNAPAYASPNSTLMWLQQWATEQFGAGVATQTAIIMSNYSMLTARRKYELLDPTIYSLINYNEADTVLQEWAILVNAATAVYNSLSPEIQPSFFEMVLQPCMAGSVVHQLYIGTAKNNLYAEQSRTSTNTWAGVVQNLFNQDHAITQVYHNLLGGKWNHMMDQTHLGYQYWQQPMRNNIPPLAYTQQQETSVAGAMGVTCEANNGTVDGDDMYHTLSTNVLTLPPMDPYGPATRWIDVFSRSTGPFNYQISPNASYVNVTSPSGTLGISPNNTDIRAYLSVDWESAPVGSSMVTINIATTTPSGNYLGNQSSPYGNYAMPTIVLPVNKTIVPSSFHGFVESDATISIEPEHFSNNVSVANSTAYYEVIPGYGRTLSGVMLLPFTAPSQPASSSSPRLTYDMYTFSNVSNANVTVYTGMAFNTNPSQPLQYAVSFDTPNPQIVQPIPNTTLGTLPNMWTNMVSNAGTSNTTTHDLSQTGAHTLNLWLLEPGLTVQKIVIDLGGVRQSYLGPPESTIV